jgi:hypothetical protein
MAELPHQAVYVKSPQGSDEVATRRHGLSMRVRQLLILVDGRRSIADLSRMVPEKEVLTHMEMLEAQGFVLRADGGTSTAQGIAAGPGSAEGPGDGPPTGVAPGVRAWATVLPSAAGLPLTGRAGPATVVGPAGRSGPATVVGPAGPATVVRAAQAGPATVVRTAGTSSAPSAAAAPIPPASPVAASQRRDLETIRRGVVRHLVDTIGPHADGMAVRIERCHSVDEIRQLMPTVAGLVEAVRGRAAMLAFVQHVGPV